MPEVSPAIAGDASGVNWDHACRNGAPSSPSMAWSMTATASVSSAPPSGRAEPGARKQAAVLIPPVGALAAGSSPLCWVVS
jgi:hypothetical protein